MSRVDIEQQCARRLRELRRRKGMTLEEFEKFSNGRIKAVVLGSYERGTRAISLARLNQLADIYEVDLNYFLSPNQIQSGEAIEFILDLRKLRRNEDDPELRSITVFCASILIKRNDWNGEVLTVRKSDIEIISMLEGKSPSELQQLLTLKGALFQRS
jgi:transcriptional regulator with XRE-family HTH domain